MEDYPALVDKTLEPLGFIELNPNPTFCTLVNNDELVIEENDFSLFPNPVNELLFLNNKNPKLEFIQVFDVVGNLILEKNITLGDNEINTTDWESGIYFIGNTSSSYFKKIIK